MIRLLSQHSDLPLRILELNKEALPLFQSANAVFARTTTLSESCLLSSRVDSLAEGLSMLQKLLVPLLLSLFLPSQCFEFPLLLFHLSLELIILLEETLIRSMYFDSLLYLRLMSLDLLLEFFSVFLKLLNMGLVSQFVFALRLLQSFKLLALSLIASKMLL